MSSPIERITQQRKEADLLSKRCRILGLMRGVFLAKISERREGVLQVASWTPGQQRVRLRFLGGLTNLKFSESDAALDEAEKAFGDNPSFPAILGYALDDEIIAEVKRRGLTIE